MKQPKKKSKTGGFGDFDQKAGHNIYSNPFNKKPFAISQLKMTDTEFVARRLQMQWFESAQIQLQYIYKQQE